MSKERTKLGTFVALATPHAEVDCSLIEYEEWSFSIHFPMFWNERTDIDLQFKEKLHDITHSLKQRLVDKGVRAFVSSQDITQYKDVREYSMCVVIDPNSCKDVIQLNHHIRLAQAELEGFVCAYKFLYDNKIIAH